MKYVYLLLIFLFAANARAGISDCVSQEQFRALAAELAPKVNLFAEAWKQDPEAEFYGGTTRDYLYWLKGKFRDCYGPGDSAQIVNELRSEPTIDVRAFIVGDSDVDVVSKRGVSIRPERFGIKKQDSISPDIFDVESTRGKNEAVQGYIPAEKIRLRRDGTVKPAQFGDGLGEIYSGKLTVHFTPTEIFAQGHYAKEGLNHPILLALRYLRLAGINYHQTYGGGWPNLAKLFDLDPASAKAVKAVVDRALKSGELEPFLKKTQFATWLNGALQKAFRSYTNPTAAMELMKKFRVDQLQRVYPGIEPLNQYLFAKPRDQDAVQNNLAKLHTSPGKLYQSPAKLFPDGYIYHGTGDESAFRGILLQGTLPSRNGSAGAGLYGVAGTNKQFAEKWGGDKNRLVRLSVHSTAKIVDITHGEGKRIWEETGRHFSTFADEVGADILLYPYETQAFVVKNSAALGKAEGVYRHILLLGEAKKMAGRVHNLEELSAFSETLQLNQFNSTEIEALAAAIPNNWTIEAPHWRPDPSAFLKFTNTHFNNPVTAQLLAPKFGPDYKFLRESLDKIEGETEFNQFVYSMNWMGKAPNPALVSEEAMKGFMDRAGKNGWLHGWEQRSENIHSYLSKLTEHNNEGQFARAIVKYQEPEIFKKLAKFYNFSDIVKLDENSYSYNRYSALFPSDVRAKLAKAWKENGAFREFAKPLNDLEELDARLGRLNSVGKLFAEELATEIIPIFRSSVREKWPNPLNLLEELQKLRAPLESKTVRGLLAIKGLQSDATPEELRKFFPEIAGSSTNSLAAYFRSPWVKIDEPTLKYLLQKSPLRLQEILHDDFAEQLMQSDALNDAFWKELREAPTGVFSSIYDFAPQMKILKARDPERYNAGLESFLRIDPEEWTKKLEKSEAAGKYEAIEPFSKAFIPTASGDPFFAFPHSGKWLGYFMRMMADPYKWQITSSFEGDVLKFFTFPEVQQSPASTLWLEGFIKKTVRDSKVTDKALAALLETKPWVNHPMHDIWVRSLRSKTDGILTIYPRERYIDRWKKLNRSLSTQIEQWQKSLSDPSIILTPPAPASCASAFMRLIKGGIK